MSKQEKAIVQCECKDCGGTGLYTSVPECHDGAAKICKRCNGTGYEEISYVPFTGRKECPNIVRVFASENRGVLCLYGTDRTFPNGTTTEYSKYGCSYEDWKNGAIPMPFPEPEK